MGSYSKREEFDINTSGAWYSLKSKRLNEDSETLLISDMVTLTAAE
ncbi:MAG: hypothetical protein ACM3SR_16545 [Ignavibacteriales bacterium]